MIYKVLKRIVDRGVYDPEDIKNKMDVYLAFDRITQEQYNELLKIIES